MSVPVANATCVSLFSSLFGLSLIFLPKSKMFDEIQANFINVYDCRGWDWTCKKWQNSSSRPSGAKCWFRFGSTLVQVMACCWMAQSHHLTQCWLFVSLSVCLSIHPSVRPASFVPSVTSTVFWMESFLIRHKWLLAWEGVLCTMTFHLDLYL